IYRYPRYFKNILLYGMILSILMPLTANAQKLNVPYVTTPPEVVDKMMEVAGVGPGDYVIDLGSGDGRIVIEAARRDAVGHGLEIDSGLVRKAENNAQKAGVSDRVMFLNKDVFHGDFSRANVITTYMTTTLHTRLRPKLLNTLEPGSLVVSHDFHMGRWKPDKHVKAGNHDIYFWVVPATIEGRWYWHTANKRFTMSVRQTFQEIQLNIKADNIALTIDKSKISGNRISFTAKNPDNGNHYAYHGVVKGIIIDGTVQIEDGKEKRIESWSATLHKQ
ncbi:MAG: SAM-dependent methyltransferase, partial [Bacteroidota bacterium]